MAKTYVDVLKYVVEAKFEIAGLVEKPDIIGAVFGQTEGLLGSELDLRELQKNGKIGRIEIEVSSAGNRTYGKLHLPSSLPRVDTCILAAAIEAVDKVGPFETHIAVEKIEDTRNAKREQIIGRARQLLKNLLSTEIPDSRELSELVESSVKTSNISTYGSESLPCAPGIDKKEEITLVEGRADVINLLKNDIDNCIAVGGAAGTVPKSIISLCATKEATLFVDGDRGGEMIIRSVLNNADIDFVAKAPDGKEVEELTRKEIIKALRARVPAEQVLNAAGHERHADGQRHNRTHGGARQEQRQYQPECRSERVVQKADGAATGSVMSPSQIAARLTGRMIEEQPEAGTPYGQKGDKAQFEDIDEGLPAMHKDAADDEIPLIVQKDSGTPDAAAEEGFIAALGELKNTLRGRIYGRDGKMLREVPVREIVQAVQEERDPDVVVFDGIITQRLVELASKKGIHAIYGIRTNQLARHYDDIRIYTAEAGT